MSTSESPAQPSLRDWTLSTCWCLVLALTCVRAISTFEAFPWWDIDPTRIEATSSGLRPTASLAIDLAILAASAAVMALAAGTLAWFAIIVLGAGLVAIAAHALIINGIDLDNLRIGATWAAAAAAALAAWSARHHSVIARLTAAVFLGSIAMLAAKGAVQVFIEHPTTLAHFRQDPNVFLESQGWSPGSSSARAFERRLSHSEATGWFGLSNILSSFAAAMLVALAAFLSAAVRSNRRARGQVADGWLGVVALGMLAAGACLWLTNSKGGLTAAAIGIALLAGRMLLSRAALARVALALTPRATGLLSVALVLSALLSLVVRGAVGERVGELSLLFRWFYIRGAWSIWAANPGLGVGPADFKDAYMLAKPAISPEEVSSPHSVLWDLAACLGVGGIALAALVVAAIYAAGRALSPSSLSQPRDVSRPRERSDGSTSAPSDLSRPRERSDSLWPRRAERRLLALTICAACIASAFIERSAGTPDTALLRVVGLVGWLGLSLGILEVVRAAHAWGWGLALAAIVLATHGQIEVTPVWQGSAALWAILLATGAGLGTSPHPTTSRAARARTIAAPTLVTVFALAIAVLGLPRVTAWERNLRDAAEFVRPVARLTERLRTFQTSTDRGTDSIDKIAADVGALLGEVPPRDSRAFDLALARLLTTLSARAETPLRAATHAFPTHTATSEALCQLLVQQAFAFSAQGLTEQSERCFTESIEAAKALGARAPRVAANHGLIGSMYDAHARHRLREGVLEQAIDAWRLAAALDPFGTTFPMRIARAEAALKDTDEARSWAQRVLDLDRGLRLDPLRQLTPDERREMERIVKGE
ncbi:MAG: hypothetical protein ACKVW3_09505 [Phycisphaerales bacterium]